MLLDSHCDIDCFVCCCMRTFLATPYNYLTTLGRLMVIPDYPYSAPTTHTKCCGQIFVSHCLSWCFGLRKATSWCRSLVSLGSAQTMYRLIYQAFQNCSTVLNNFTIGLSAVHETKQSSEIEYACNSLNFLLYAQNDRGGSYIQKLSPLTNLTIIFDNFL